MLAVCNLLPVLPDDQGWMSLYLNKFLMDNAQHLAPNIFLVILGRLFKMTWQNSMPLLHTAGDIEIVSSKLLQALESSKIHPSVVTVLLGIVREQNWDKMDIHDAIIKYMVTTEKGNSQLAMHLLMSLSQNRIAPKRPMLLFEFVADLPVIFGEQAFPQTILSVLQSLIGYRETVCEFEGINPKIDFLIGIFTGRLMNYLKKTTEGLNKTGLLVLDAYCRGLPFTPSRSGLLEEYADGILSPETRAALQNFRKNSHAQSMSNTRKRNRKTFDQKQGQIPNRKIRGIRVHRLLARRLRRGH